MKLDLQKVTLRRLLESGSSELYAKFIPEYFTGMNSLVYERIQNFYRANTRLPTKDEFLSQYKDASIQEYLDLHLFNDETNPVPEIEDEFLLSQLQDFFVREETLAGMDKILEEIQDLEKNEIIDKIEALNLKLQSAVPSEGEVFEVSELELFPKEEDFRLFPTGWNADYDNFNGGLATQELVLLGGRRGSGKSIIALNTAIHRYLMGETVALFSIEMRYKEVYNRLMSIISEVDFLDIYKNKLTPMQKLTMIKAKMDFVYQPNQDIILSAIEEVEKTHDFEKFERLLIKEKNTLKRRENQFMILDVPELTISRIDHHCKLFKAKYPRFSMAVVDYLNIIKSPDQKDWKTQIDYADMLKLTARRYDLTALSPYQIDASGEARFAKGILDSADRSFIFMPADNDGGEVKNQLEMHTSKIRNGKAMDFPIAINWNCVKVISQTGQLNSKLRPIEKYDSDSAKDIPA